MIVLILVCLLTPQIAAVVNATSQQPKATAQTRVDREKLKQQAQEISDAFVSSDFTRFADLAYPKLIEMAGGRERFIAAVEKMKTELEGGQYRILSITAGEPLQIEKIGSEYYAIVPTITRIKVPTGTLVGEAGMIGISTDGGQNWTFIDAPSKQKVSALFGPTVADRLRLPETKRPVLYP